MGRPSRSPVARGAVLGAVLVGAALLPTGCGGSLADIDAPNPARASGTPPGDFCSAVLVGADATRPLAALLTRGGAVPRAELDAATARVRGANADMLATAPEEIRADVERSVTTVDLQLDALEFTGGDAGALARDAAMRRRLATPEYTVAARRVREYVDGHCGLDARLLGG